MSFRFTLVFFLTFSLTAFIIPTSKEGEIQPLIRLIENKDSEIIEELELIPAKIISNLNNILSKEYKGRNPEPTFELKDKYSAPSRGYKLKGQNFRRFNFAVNKGDDWLISYHVTTERFSYNNVLFVSLKKRKQTIKSFQINRGSRDPESLLSKLQNPGSVELLYPAEYESNQIIF